MLFYLDMTKKLCPVEDQVVRDLQSAAMHMDRQAWDFMLENPIVRDLIELKIIQIGKEK